MNNDDTPTPRTDEEAWLEDRAYVLPIELVQADFARTLERELAAAQAELAALRERNERLKKGCIKLNLAIDRIDYACGEPNEMEVSDYAVHQNEEAVVERVKTTLAQLRAALCEIFDLTDPYADGAPDASEHDKLCNKIAYIAKKWTLPPPPKGGES